MSFFDFGRIVAQLKSCVGKEVFCSLITMIGAGLFTSIAVAGDLPLQFRISLIDALENNESILKFYDENDFKPVWLGTDMEAAKRRVAFVQALERADVHALPKHLYPASDLTTGVQQARNAADLGALEAKFMIYYLRYANDIATGILRPNSVTDLIARKVKRIPLEVLFSGIASNRPEHFIFSLPPQTDEYKNLLKARQEMLELKAEGGFGALIPDGKYQLGDTGTSVIKLRKRLAAKGYGGRSISTTYDVKLQDAVKAFQRDNGLSVDGVAGPATLKAINSTVEDQLKSITVALERERWFNSYSLKKEDELGRQILVNLTDFTAKILDNDVVTFETRSVIGAIEEDRRSPEFSDTMEYMVINPTWYVPRSITVKEYLPELQQDPSEHSYLTMFSPDGNVVPREFVDFTLYDENTFPYEMKQLPSESNALGLVKFMFPNRHNIYLHDTPHKSLFQKEKRAFSHGCIRLHKPFDFAYALLARQSNDPVSEFQSILKAGNEYTLPLKVQIPVHIIYRTAVSSPNGRIGFRDDIYGRDALVYAALLEQGVVMDNIQG